MATSSLEKIYCAWTTPVLGVEGNLLYFGPILKNLATCFHDFTVYTCEYKGNQKDIGFKIEICGKFKRLYKNERFINDNIESYPKGISISSPKIFMALLRGKPELIIINEFSLFSLYASISKLFIRSKVLCIVETRPNYIRGSLSGTGRLLLRKLICSLCNAFLTNNKQGFDYLINELGVRQEKIITKPYLVSDLSASTNNQYIDLPSINSDKINLLYVGQLVKRKGLHLAIESLALLSEECKEAISFNIVGEGPYRGELDNLVKKHRLKDIVRFHGRVEYDKLCAYYANSTAFIFPTLSDYRALSPFEALSYGIPIFASIYDGGISETVAEGENGHAFDPKDTTQLVKHLEQFIKNKMIQEKYAARSREIAKSYNLDSAISALTDACELALK